MNGQRRESALAFSSEVNIGSREETASDKTQNLIVIHQNQESSSSGGRMTIRTWGHFPGALQERRPDIAVAWTP